MRNAHSSIRRVPSVWLVALAFLVAVPAASVAADLPGDSLQAIVTASGAPGVVARVETADGQSWTGADGKGDVCSDLGDARPQPHQKLPN